MRALVAAAIPIFAFSLRMAAQHIETPQASQFVLSSHHVYDEYYDVHLVTIHDDKTVVIVLDGPTLFQARPGHRFCVTSGEKCTHFRLIAVDVQHQRAVLEADHRHHTATNKPET
jgi:hypothetical protein